MTQKEIDLAKVVAVLKDNKKPIGVVTAVTTLLAIVYCIFATPIFTAKTLINPPKLSDAGTSFSQVISGLGVLTGGGGGLVPKTDADITIAILNTTTVKDMLIRQFDLIKLWDKKDIELTRRSLAGVVKFIPDMKSGFVEIDVDNKDPKLAAAMANYYTIALGQAINNIAYGRANQRYQFYQKQLGNAITSLNKAESALRVFSEKNGIVAGQQAQIIAGISTQLQAQLIAAQAQLQSVSYYASPNNSDYLALESQVLSLKQQIQDLNNQGGDNIAIPVGLAPTLANEYIGLMRDFKFKELVYEVMLKQAKAAQLDAQSEIMPMAIQVVDPAQVPIYKSRPKRLIVLVVSTFVGFLFWSLVVIGLNRKKIIKYRDGE